MKLLVAGALSLRLAVQTGRRLVPDLSGMAGAMYPRLALQTVGVPMPAAASEENKEAPSSGLASLLDGFLLAVPKKKISYSRKRMKWPHMELKNVATYSCRKCGKLKQPHRVCEKPNCDRPHLDGASSETAAPLKDTPQLGVPEAETAEVKA